MSKQIGVTRRTIENWFHFLDQPYSYGDYHAERKLSFFPSLHLSELGLGRVHVFYQNPIPSIAKLWPMRMYVGRVYNPDSNEASLSVEYVIPKEFIRDFLRLLPRVKKKGLCSKLNWYLSGSNYAALSPIHNTIDSRGNFDPSKMTTEDTRNELSSMQLFLSSQREVGMSKHVYSNPLIVPVWAESLYQRRTSVGIWEALKNKLGEQLTEYLPRTTERHDVFGIRQVQKILKNLHICGLLNQMRVVYFPLEFPPTLCIWLIMDCRNNEEILEFAEVAIRHSWAPKIFPFSDGKTMFTLQIDGESFQRLFDPLSSFKVEKLYFFDFSKWNNLVTTTNYNIYDYDKLFDPVSCSWRFDSEHLKAELDTFSGLGLFPDA
jgi:hypothetical protein